MAAVPPVESTVTGEFMWAIANLEGRVVEWRWWYSREFEGAGQRWQARLQKNGGKYYNLSLNWLGAVPGLGGDSPPPPPLVRYKVFSEDEDGDERHLIDSNWFPAREVTDTYYTYYFNTNVVFKTIHVLRFEITAKIKRSPPAVLPPKMSQDQLALAASYRSLWADGTLADLEVVVDFGWQQAQKFKAHRAILAARSPVFAAMFQEKTASRELLEGRLVIVDIRPQVFHCLLEYIYTGETEMGLQECAADLIVAADKYQLLELKTTCSKHLATVAGQITVENAGKLLELAWKHETGELKQAVLVFIQKNKAAVRATEGWKELKNNPALMFELLDNDAISQK